jgi:hypothetical protein
VAKRAINWIAAFASSVVLVASMSVVAGGTTVKGHVPNTSLCRADAASSKAFTAELYRYEMGGIGPNATWTTTRTVLLTLLTSNLETYRTLVHALRHAPESVRSAGPRDLSSIGAERGVLVKSKTLKAFDSASWPSSMTTLKTVNRYLLGKCGVIEYAGRPLRLVKAPGPGASSR